MSDFHPNDTHLITGTFLQLDHWDDTEGARFQQQIGRASCRERV